MKITEKDLHTIEAIKQYHKEHGYMPSYREIGDMIGVSSSNSVYDRMQRLYASGLIETDMEFNCPRAFRLKRGESDVGE